MAFTSGAKTGLPTNIDLDDTTWTQKYLDGNKALEERISKTTSGDPNGAVVGDFYGQPCWSTGRGVVYECIKPGPATGATAALWVPREYVPVGTISFFFRNAVPAGWLPFTGLTYLKVNYPNLYNVLPSGITTTGTSFTLPDLRGGILTFRNPIGSEPLPLVGQVNDALPFANGVNYPTNALPNTLINALIGIKY